jgi:hypothetical protein
LYSEHTQDGLVVDGQVQTLIHSKRSRRQRLGPATSSPCLTTGIPLLLHGSDDERAERVIFDERSAVAEDRALVWTLYNLPEIEDRRAVP